MPPLLYYDILMTRVMYVTVHFIDLCFSRGNSTIRLEGIWDEGFQMV